MSSAKKEEKYQYWENLWKLVEEYPQILICSADNVGSKQMQNMRRALRGTAVVLFGKNTLIRAGLKKRIEEPKESDEDYERRKDNWYQFDELNDLIPLIKGNVGLIFCKGNMDKVLEIIDENKVPAEAKAGTIAPCDVTVPPGPTGMDPSMTAFFQALGIATKIAKGQIEIVTSVQVVETDKKVGNSEAVLLKKLGIKPFHFGLIPRDVYDNGSVYSAEVLKLTDEIVMQKFMNGVKNIAAMSLEVGVPTAASVPHSIVRGFKNLVSIAYGIDYDLKQASDLLTILKDPSKLAALQAASAAPAAGETKEEAPQEEEDAEEDIEMGGLFGDEDDF
mmetsp:Transcript_7457/g.10987  ORF Transcript_7457/g.10987 Transcript_7457/m.10987 type:complete len:334 (+) Transcript_7457:28-1029(+)